jgi:hypothetical protein
MLSDEVKLSIEKNLPGEVGSVLKQRLLQADTDATEVMALRGEIKLLKDDLNKLSVLKKTLDSLEARDAAIAKREQAMEVFEAKLKQAESDKRADAVTKIVELVFHSPVYFRSVNGSVPFPSGQYGVGSYNKTENETITQQ